MNFLTGGQSGRIVNSFRNARRVMGMGKLGATAHSIGQGIKGLSKVAKVGGAVSALMSVAQVASSVVDYSGQKKNLDQQFFRFCNIIRIHRSKDSGRNIIHICNAVFEAGYNECHDREKDSK